MLRLLTTIGIVIATVYPVYGQNDSGTDANASAVRFRFREVRGRKARHSSAGRYEGELHLELQGTSRVQGMKNYGNQWSGDAHVLWDGAVGDSMVTSFEVDTAGVYDLSVQLTVAGDYGRFDLSLNGNRVLQGIDLYGPRVALAPLQTLKNVRLKSGRQTMTFQLTGSHPQARRFRNRGYLLGLDYVQLTRTDTPRPDPGLSPTGGSASGSVQTGGNHRPLPFQKFTSTLKQYCSDCHGEDAGKDHPARKAVNLKAWASPQMLISNIRTTRLIRDTLSHHRMPPENEVQPSEALRGRLIATLNLYLEDYLKAHRSSTPVVMRRLNRYEYNNAVRDLLHLKGDLYPLPEKTIRSDQDYFRPSSGRFPTAVRVGNRTLGKNQVEKQILTGVSPFAIDLQAEGGFNNRGRELSLSPLLLESFLKLGQAIVSSPEFDGYCGLTSTLLAAPATVDPAEQKQIARERLAAFLERAFRNPIDQPLLDRYHQFFVRQLETTGSYTQSFKNVIAAVLASPRFIYLVEPAVKDSQDEALNSWELATRLSFFLWSSIPDEELLALARDGSLREPAILDHQVRRMLEDRRCQALSTNFARQWLRLDQLITAVPDFERFPRYYSRIGCEQWKFGLQTMLEPLLLFESMMVEDRSILLLIDSDYTYRSDELQSWYSDPVPFADRQNRNRFNTNQQVYRRRKLQDRRHGGVITSAATLTMTSAPLRTSPIVRGAWVATVIFNQPPPPPPDSVPPIEADDRVIEASGLTLRQRLVEHQVNPSCIACHSRIDPLGFALENYDAVGRWRDRYSPRLAIDASGTLFGKSRFQDAVGLKDAILDHPDWFLRAFSEHLLSYSLGRKLTLSDSPAVDEIVARVTADHGQFTTVVRSIVQSHPFRFRVSQDAAEEPR